MNEKRWDTLLICLTSLWLVLALAGRFFVEPTAHEGWRSELARSIGVFVGLALLSMGPLYVRIATLRARITQLEAKAAQKASGTEPPKDDDHLRKLHISRLE